MAYHKLFSNKNIKEYNEIFHVGLTGKDLFTLDESEVEDFKQWIIKNRPNQKFASLIEFHQKVESRRKSSFWFDGHVSTVTNGKTIINIIASGRSGVYFEQNGKEFENNAARKEAIKRGYTDKKIYILENNDMFSNTNWFELERSFDGGNNFDKCENIVYAELNYAIREAKSFCNL